MQLIITRAANAAKKTINRTSLLQQQPSNYFKKQPMGQAIAKMSSKTYPPPVVMGNESIMSKKAHGTSAVPVQENLRWSCDRTVADRICNFNRHYAEHSGYFQSVSEFLTEAAQLPADATMTFYDSNTGKKLFTAPKGRTMEQFLKESRNHGWPSFRDAEVDWEYVRVLSNGETVSVDGTHLGHNLPDGKGNRYCINLVCVAGRAEDEDCAAES